MPNLRQINFGGQGQQQIAQQQTPKGMLAQLLLQRAGQRDNTVGSGIRSAGENILGALLKKQAFEEQQDRLANQQANTADVINSNFLDTTRQEPVGTDLQSLFQAQGGGLNQFNAPTQDQLGITPKEFGIQEGDVGTNQPGPQFSNVALQDEFQTRAAGPNLADAVRAFNAQGGRLDSIDRISPPASIDPRQFQQEDAPVGTPDIQDPFAVQFEGTGQGLERATETITEPNKMRGLLLAMNQASQGGIDPALLLNLQLQEQQRQQDIKRDDLKFTRGLQKDLLLKNIDISSREMISNNTITSREEIARLNREAKAGERIKVNVKLGNDDKTGRPITQVGFAKRSDPSDIKFIGKPTVSGKGNQVNVSTRNLPQIPASMFNAITDSRLNLRAIGRIEDIMNRVDISGLVGPVDSRVQTALEAIGLPDKDAQAIDSLTTDMREKLARMNSGGVISNEEWKTFDKLVPTRKDNFPSFVNKMTIFKQKMRDIEAVNVETAATFDFNVGSSQLPGTQQQNKVIKFDAQGNRIN